MLQAGRADRFLPDEALEKLGLCRIFAVHDLMQQADIQLPVFTVPRAAGETASQLLSLGQKRRSVIDHHFADLPDRS